MRIIYSKIYSLIKHDYPKNNAFWDYNFKLHSMIDMHSKYDNMHRNEMFYAWICTTSHVIISINCMLLGSLYKSGWNATDVHMTWADWALKPLPLIEQSTMV